MTEGPMSEPRNGMPAVPSEATEARSFQKKPGRPLGGVIRNVTSNWAGIVVGIGLSFVLSPLIVTSLGNVHYGIWTLLMQFTGYLWLFDFGVRESVVKYVAQYYASGEHDELETTVRAAVSLYSLVALVALVAVVALAFILPYAFNIPPDAVRVAQVTAVLAGATIAQSFVFNVFVGVLMGLQKFYLIARLGVLFGVARALFLYLLLTAGYGIIALAMLQLGLSLVSNVLTFRLCRKDLPYLSMRLTWPRWAPSRRLLNYGKYVLIANVGDKLIFATDSIVIGASLPISALTYYAIGGSLIEYLRSFITSMGAVLNPLSSSLEARKETGAVATVLVTGSKISVLLGLPVCIGFIVLGERFISLWMGSAYGPPSGTVLAVLAAGYLVGMPYYSISGVLYGLGRHRIVALSRIFEGVANLVLSVVLVRSYGLVGVALGTVIPHVIVAGLVLPLMISGAVAVRRREYYESTYLRPFIASIPFWLACWWVARVVQPASLVTFFLSVAVALPVYLLPCWWIALSGDERNHLREAVLGRLGVRSRVQPAPLV